MTNNYYDAASKRKLENCCLEKYIRQYFPYISPKETPHDNWYGGQHIHMFSFGIAGVYISFSSIQYTALL